MNKVKQKRVKKILRHQKIRSRVLGTSSRPRLSVFRSDKHIYAQVIDDASGKTLVSVSDVGISTGTKSEKAAEVGKKLAEIAKNTGIKSVSFDRGGNRYHGRVKALADSAREEGLDF